MTKICHTDKLLPETSHQNHREVLPVCPVYPAESPTKQLPEATQMPQGFSPFASRTLIASITGSRSDTPSMT
jgi:hypothetical protein